MIKNEQQSGFRLAKPTEILEQSYIDYISEWENSGEEIVPYASRRGGLSFNELLARWYLETTDAVYENGWVPASLFFLEDDAGKIYGAIHIRHELNEYLRSYGGHIGYGIRPSERRKGYATKMLALALPVAKSIGIDKVLITCRKGNIGSARTILNNAGMLECEVVEEKEITQRYWVLL